MDSVDLQNWVNKTQSETDEATLAPAIAMAATLDLDADFKPGAILPPLWHWLYFLPKTRRSELGLDGHAKRGGFLPPVTLPRRAWAGSRLLWQEDLRIGEKIHRTSTIESVNSEPGRGEELVFVKVRHEILKSSGAKALTEWQDIVYRGAPPPSAQPAAAPACTAPADAEWTQHWEPDPVLLFRFSALTFNAHRIHYDYPYATGKEEGFVGLVVHRPLLAVLMLQLARDHAPTRTVREFEFRGLSTVTVDAGFDVCGNPEADGQGARLFVRGKNGMLCTEGRIGFDGRR